MQGIALASDPKYKVLDAAYPWVARRLLTDPSPELRATLTALLYKAGRFDFARMRSLVVQAVRPAGASAARKAAAGEPGARRRCRSGARPSLGVFP